MGSMVVGEAVKKVLYILDISDHRVYWEREKIMVTHEWTDEQSDNVTSCAAHHS